MELNRWWASRWNKWTTSQHEVSVLWAGRWVGGWWTVEHTTWMGGAADMWGWRVRQITSRWLSKSRVSGSVQERDCIFWHVNSAGLNHCSDKNLGGPFSILAWQFILVMVRFIYCCTVPVSRTWALRVFLSPLLRECWDRTSGSQSSSVNRGNCLAPYTCDIPLCKAAADPPLFVQDLRD